MHINVDSWCLVNQACCGIKKGRWVMINLIFGMFLALKIIYLKKQLIYYRRDMQLVVLAGFAGSIPIPLLSALRHLVKNVVVSCHFSVKKSNY